MTLDKMTHDHMNVIRETKEALDGAVKSLVSVKQAMDTGDLKAIPWPAVKNLVGVLRMFAGPAISGFCGETAIDLSRRSDRLGDVYEVLAEAVLSR